MQIRVRFCRQDVCCPNGLLHTIRQGILTRAVKLASLIYRSKSQAEKITKRTLKTSNAEDTIRIIVRDTAEAVWGKKRVYGGKDFFLKQLY